MGINRYKAAYVFIQSPSELEVEELRGLKLKIKCLARTSHLEAVVLTVEEHMRNGQNRLANINFSDVARDVRRIYPGSFLGPDGSQKDVRNVARMSCNALRK